jgi:hypothetical protein
MKPFSIFRILTAATAVSFVCLALVLLIPQAQAGKGSSSRPTTTGSKASSAVRDHRGVAPKLTCVGPYCPRRPSEKAPTTGTSKANPGVSVRDHRDPNNDASPQGGVRITGEKPRPTPLCAGWGC